jgi:hypothetical protein
MYRAEMSLFIASAGLNCAKRKGGPEADQLDTMTKHIERAPLVELTADAVEQHRLCSCSVVLRQGLPRLQLRRLHPREHV